MESGIWDLESGIWNPDPLPLPITQAAGSVQPLEVERPVGDLDKGIPNPVLPKLHNTVYQAEYQLAADDTARIARVLTPNTKKCFVEAPLAPQRLLQRI